MALVLTSGGQKGHGFARPNKMEFDVVVSIGEERYQDNPIIRTGLAAGCRVSYCDTTTASLSRLQELACLPSISFWSRELVTCQSLQTETRKCFRITLLSCGLGPGLIQLGKLKLPISLTGFSSAWI